MANAPSGRLVKSLVHPDFWRRYSALPADVQTLAKKCFALWMADPRYPSLQFKPLKHGQWSARVGAHYRAVGYFADKNTFLWTWIGTHEEYNKL